MMSVVNRRLIGVMFKQIGSIYYKWLSASSSPSIVISGSSFLKVI